MVLGQKYECSPNIWLSSPNPSRKFKRQKKLMLKYAKIRQ
jgi:hypothetical protein